MASAAIALGQWNAEYYETMAATAKVSLAIERGKILVSIVLDLHSMSKDFQKLIAALERLESFPSSILLNDDAKDIPDSLRKLFRSTCELMEQRLNTLTTHWLVGRPIKASSEKISKLNQLLIGFADRFEVAQERLRSRVPADQVQQYHESIVAYRNCTLVPDSALDDEDLKSNNVRLHF